MQSFVTTSTLGGTQGAMFQDVMMRSPDGKFFVNAGTKKEQLDANRPIKQMKISSGWVIDGFSVTYNLAGGTTTTLTHGSQFPQAATIDFNANEVLVAVYGRAGSQTYYGREFVSQVYFDIFNTSTATTRTAGPFGNGNGANEGNTFYCSDVMAFGGFAENKDTLGLSGLFFIKDGGKQ
ncbi:hypothetical protein C2E23DRAFT_540146 [Lenzites betulinus]|nr:hypothetical protein C2E23DRAFT_540146 [Lenzites betulinus]